MLDPKSLWGKHESKRPTIGKILRPRADWPDSNRFDQQPTRNTYCLLTEPMVPAAGTVLSTTTVALGPEAGASEPSLVAVPAASEMLRLPLPLMLERVTVRLEVPDPVTATLALAVPVLFKLTFAAVSETPVALE